MPDETIPAMNYPNTTSTVSAPATPDRQPAHSQTTHPSTTAHDPEPEASTEAEGKA